MKVLFVCGFGRDRSATAAVMYQGIGGVEARWGGINEAAVVPVGREAFAWADVVVYFEALHRRKAQRRFGETIDKGKRRYVLGIANRYRARAMGLQLMIAAKMDQVAELRTMTPRLLEDSEDRGAGG